MSEPWERQPDESAQAFRAFAAYRDLGATRSVTAAYVKVTGRLGARGARHWWYEWHSKYGWALRVNAWDAELDRQARQVQIDAVREMNERHITIARALFQRVAQRLTTIEAGELSPQDIARWTEVAYKLERLARGEATERVDVVERVRQLAREMGLDVTEEALAVSEAQRIIRETR